MNIKSLFLAAAMAVGAVSAHSATLDQVDVVAGGASLSGTGSVGVGPGGAFSIAGVLIDPAGTPPANLIDVSVNIGTPTEFLAVSLFPFPNPVLSGALEDISDDNGVVTALFSSGVGSATFGSLFRLTATDAAILDGVLTSGVPTFFANASLTVEAVALTTPIPLPASGILLIAATGGLMVMRRKSASA